MNFYNMIREVVLKNENIVLIGKGGEGKTTMIKKLFPNIDKNKIIDVNVMENYIINILCTSISNKTTVVIYKISN